MVPLTPPFTHAPSPSPSPPPFDPTDVSVDLAPLPTLKAKGDAHIDFDGQLEQPLAYHEDVRTGCGGQTWPAGLVLGKHMLRYRLEGLQEARMLVHRLWMQDHTGEIPTVERKRRARDRSLTCAA